MAGPAKKPGKTSHGGRPGRSRPGLLAIPAPGDAAKGPAEPHGDGRGRVVLVATPIGNLADLSPRAAEALAGAAYIYCEDTRHSLKLLNHAGIKGPRLVAHHRFNEASSTAAALERLEEGAVIALISDAGTPIVSDPGARLVRAAIAAGITVEAVPGPSAALAALVVSGLATERWCFEGFLPRTGRQRAERLAAVAADTERASVIFESPFRVHKALADLAEACGPGRPVAVCRELTKLHEETWRGPVGEAAAHWAERAPKGEFVIVVGAPEAAVAGSPPEAINAVGPPEAYL